ncbi:MAG: protein phosphatase 2C domain-containing protein [Polyangiaceae bacterium]
MALPARKLSPVPGRGLQTGVPAGRPVSGEREAVSFHRPALRAHAAGVTHVGRVRATNQDAFLLVSLDNEAEAARHESTGAVHGERVLLAVSDGMGGAAAGEIASAVTLASLQRALPIESDDWRASLRKATLVANAEVLEASRVPGRHGMGATLTAACVHDGVVDIAQVGDSRAYLFRDGRLRQLTIDQTWVQTQVDLGRMTQAEAATSSLRNVLAAAMGGGREVRPVVERFGLAPRDLLLLCSDGLTNELADAEIAAILTVESSPAAASARLLRAAYTSGAHDNVTVLLATIRSPA